MLERISGPTIRYFSQSTGGITTAHARPFPDYRYLVVACLAASWDGAKNGLEPLVSMAFVTSRSGTSGQDIGSALVANVTREANSSVCPRSTLR